MLHGFYSATIQLGSEFSVNDIAYMYPVHIICTALVGKFLSVPVIGSDKKSPILTPNLVYICYREGNLIVIEKCCSWQNCCETDVI